MQLSGFTNRGRNYFSYTYYSNDERNVSHNGDRSGNFFPQDISVNWFDDCAKVNSISFIFENINKSNT